MTGRQLLEKLQAFSAEQLDLEVEIEGCDCWGEAGDVAVDDNFNAPIIAITRQSRTKDR
jgi:hypothetical protein